MSKAKHSKCLNDEGELYLRQGGCLCQYRASAIDIVCQCLARQGRHLNCVTLSMDIRYKPRPSSLTSASELGRARGVQYLDDIPCSLF